MASEKTHVKKQSRRNQKSPEFVGFVLVNKNEVLIWYCAYSASFYTIAARVNDVFRNSLRNLTKQNKLFNQV